MTELAAEVIATQRWLFSSSCGERRQQEEVMKRASGTSTWRIRQNEELEKSLKDEQDADKLCVCVQGRKYV